jgi:hypothetical protein
MRSLFVTALPGLEVSEAGRGFQFADELFVTNDGAHVAKLLTDAFRALAGSLATDDLLQSKAIVYALKDLLPDPAPDATAVGYIDSFLRTVNLFSMALWIIKDNAVESSDGYLQYGSSRHPGRTYVSHHSLGIFFWNATGDRTPVTFSVDELREARLYLGSLRQRLGLPGTISISPTLPTGVPRLGRVWYFVENARMNSDLAIKVATYVTSLEALLTTDSSELAHKLSERLALLIGSSSSEQQSIFERAKLAYGVRSKTLHGDDLSGKQRQQLAQVAQDCDDFVRRAVLKALSSDESARMFNGPKEGLDEYMLQLLFRGSGR